MRTALLALAIGGALGVVTMLLILPSQRLARRIDDIGSSERPRRIAAWAWLGGRDTADDPPRAVEHLPEIAAALLAADDAALVEGCDHLARLGLFGWDALPGPLVLAHLTFLVDAGLVHEPWFIVEQLVTAPADIDPAQIDAVREGLLRRSEHLPPLLPTVLTAAAAWADGVPCLRTSAERTAAATSACLAARRTDAAPWLRRLAAIQCRDFPPELIDELLAGSLRDPDGGHVTAALLAEGTLPRSEATALGRAWIADLDDDRKQAGVLLLALTGETDALQEHREVESNAWLRTLLTIAAGSGDARADATGGDGASHREVAWRARRAGGTGRLNPDVALLRLCTGDRLAVDDLLDAVAEDTAPLASDEMLRRVLPSWIDEVAPVQSGSGVAACIRARWLIGRSRARLDWSTHRFLETGR